MLEPIKEESLVFVSDGDEAIGSVRRVAPNERPELVIYIENAGDFVVPIEAVEDVHSGKVILNCERIDRRLREAIGHARDAEDPRFVARSSEDER